MEFSFQDNRVGQFSVLYEAQDERLAALLKVCTVLATEPNESGRGTDFIAAGPLFDPLREGDEIPRYRIECAYDCNFADPDLQSKRVDAGPFGFAAVRQNILRVPPVAVSSVVH